MPIASNEQAQTIARILQEKGDQLDDQTRGQLFEQLKMFNNNRGADSAPYVPRVPAGMPMAEANISPYSREEYGWADKGLDIDSALPYSTINKLALAGTEEQRAAILQQDLGNVPVRSGDSSISGQLEYLNPKTNKWVLAVPSRYGVPTLPGANKMIWETAGGVAGAIPGIIARNPYGAGAGSIAGTGVGGVIAESINQGAAKALGYNPDVTLESAGEAALHEGKVAGAYGAGGELLMGTGRFTKNFIRGFPKINLADAEKLYARVLQEDAKLTEYRKLAGPSAPFQPSVAKVVDDAHLARLEAEASTEPKVDEQQLQQIDNNLTSLQATYKKVTDWYKPEAETLPYESGQGVQKVVAQQKARAMRRSLLEKNAAEEAARAQAAGLPAMTPNQIGNRVTEMVNQEWMKAKEVTDTAYANLRKAYGLSEDQATMANNDAYWKDIRSGINITPSADKEAATKFDNYLQTATRTFGKLDSTKKNAMIAALPDGMIQEVKGGRLVLKPDTSFDLHAWFNYIQELKSGVRSNFMANKGLKLDEKDALNVATLMEDVAARHFQRKNDPRVWSLYEEAKQQAKNQYDTFENGILRRLIEKDKGLNPTADNVAFVEVFKKNDGRGAVELNHILEGDPGAKNELQNMALSLYKGFIPENGIPTKESVKKFMDQYGEAITPFFSPEEVKRFTSFEDMAGVIAKKNEKYEAMEATWKNRFRKFGRMNSYQIASAPYKEGISRGEMTDAMAFIKTNDPILHKKIQYDTAYEFWKRTADPEGTPVITKMQGLLRGPSADKIQAVMGNQYVTDLHTIMRAAEYEQRGITREHVEQMPMIRRVVRAIVRPLSREGLVTTAFWAARDKSAKRILQNTIRDPEGLRQFVDKGLYQLKSQPAWAVLGNLGGRDFAMGEGE